MSDLIRVLLVEDSPSDAALLTEWLQPKGQFKFCLTIVESLEKALTVLDVEPFDVVLLDLGLSDSTGLGTLQAVLDDHATVPIIVLTGLDDDDVGFRAVESGAQDYLIKSNCDTNLLFRSIRYAIARYRLDRERIELSRQLLTVLEDEKQRIARELHDEVGQGLSGLNMMLRSMLRKLREHGLPETEKATMISDGIQDTLDSFRRVLCGLSPVDIDSQGLVVALQRLCDDVEAKSDQMTCLMICAGEVSVSDNDIANQLFRIAQESVTNAWKHSRASLVEVELARRGSELVLRIADNGEGFDVSARNLGRGLRILRHRSELINGSLHLNSNSDGTEISCAVTVNNGTED